MFSFWTPWPCFVLKCKLLLLPVSVIEKLMWEFIVRGTVFAITGYNLGSKNFSKSRYFCRCYLKDRESFQWTHTKLGPVRSVDMYNNCVAQVSLEQEITNGVNFDSDFNHLKYYHVCSPCLGHDLFEGIVSVDLALYITVFFQLLTH